MTYKRLTQDEKQQIIASSLRIRRSGYYKRYIDKWGEVWTRISYDFLRRDSDGNVGGWFRGKGLILIK